MRLSRCLGPFKFWHIIYRVWNYAYYIQKKKSASITVGKIYVTRHDLCQDFKFGQQFKWCFSTESWTPNGLLSIGVHDWIQKWNITKPTSIKHIRIKMWIGELGHSFILVNCQTFISKTKPLNADIVAKLHSPTIKLKSSVFAIWATAIVFVHWFLQDEQQFATKHQFHYV